MNEHLHSDGKLSSHWKTVPERDTIIMQDPKQCGLEAAYNFNILCTMERPTSWIFLTMFQSIHSN